MTRKNFGVDMARRIMLRDKGTCVYCGGIATQVDHVVPASKGGPAIMANGVASCAGCNGKKRGNITEECLVRGLVYLARVGEDINWVDSLYIKSSQLTENQKRTARILLQSDLSRSDISFIINTSEEELDMFILENEETP